MDQILCFNTPLGKNEDLICKNYNFFQKSCFNCAFKVISMKLQLSCFDLGFLYNHTKKNTANINNEKIFENVSD